MPIKKKTSKEQNKFNKAKGPDWWTRMSPVDQRLYLKKHPNSKMKPSSGGKPAPKKAAEPTAFDKGAQVKTLERKAKTLWDKSDNASSAPKREKYAVQAKQVEKQIKDLKGKK